jgi:ABC-type uncharacterized transport system permease subunit
MPTSGQIALVLLAVLVFGIGAGASVARRWTNRPGLAVVMRACLVGGLLMALGVLVWHGVGRGDWVPIGDNFDALLWLAVLLSLFVMYVQRSTRLGGVDGFVMPVVILLLLAAAWFGTQEYRQYHPLVRDTWSWVHRVTAYGGAAAFAVAAASGAVYVLKSRRLRRKGPANPRWGNLERLERLMMTAVTLGFALLSVGLVTGIVKLVADKQQTSLAKVLLACSAWVVYAVVLHAPINPRFRGRKTAVLSIVGFVLMIGTIVAVQLYGGMRG